MTADDPSVRGSLDRRPKWLLMAGSTNMQLLPLRVNDPGSKHEITKAMRFQLLPDQIVAGLKRPDRKHATARAVHSHKLGRCSRPRSDRPGLVNSL